MKEITIRRCREITDEEICMERMKKNQLALMLAAAVLAIGTVFFIWYRSNTKFSGTYVAEDSVYPFPDAINGKKMILSLRNGEYMVTYLKK